MATIIEAAILAALSATVAGAQPPAEQPIQLIAEPLGDTVRVTVVGNASTVTQARYTLEVAADRASGGNRSVQRGMAQLQPGVPAQLISLTLGNVAKGGWTATLLVEPKSGPAYTISKSAD